VSNIVEDTTFWFPTNAVVSADTLTAWVADTNNKRVVIWSRPSTSSAAWTYSTQFGTYGSGDNNFSSPARGDVSPDRLTARVADTNHDRIAVWTRPDPSSTGRAEHPGRFPARAGRGAAPPPRTARAEGRTDAGTIAESCPHELAAPASAGAVGVPDSRLRSGRWNGASVANLGNT
ncbi:MAG: hypothetical protein ACKOWF_08205, partial [Chloroflexota bacterium]